MPIDSTTTWALMRGVPSTMNACELSFQAACPIDLEKARRQHDALRLTLESLGLKVDVLPADDAFPDCCFVEDTAVLIADTAVLCRPGAASRRGEVVAVKQALIGRGYQIVEMSAPATMDGGDILQIGTEIFVGLSHRTNRAGFDVIAAVARRMGRKAYPVEVHRALHLKTICTRLSEGAVIGLYEILGEGRSQLDRFRVFQPFASEEAAANVCLINDRLLVPLHCHRTIRRLANEGFNVVTVDVSEFHKAEAGVTCLSILGN